MRGPAARRGPSARGGGVIEGRDIGTVVFPDAALKVYLTASPRPGPAPVQGGHRPRLRDRRAPTSPASAPSTRGGRTAPLVEADDSVIVDTTGRSIERVVDEVLRHLDAARG